MRNTESILKHHDTKPTEPKKFDSYKESHYVPGTLILKSVTYVYDGKEWKDLRDLGNMILLHLMQILADLETVDSTELYNEALKLTLSHQ